MLTKIEINNMGKVLEALEKRRIKGAPRATLQVGYTAHYAIYVHEDLQKRHIRGEAKFLTNAAKRCAAKMRIAIKREIDNRNGLEAGLQEAGKMLLEASNRLVPVDTGYLRQTGYYSVKKGSRFISTTGGEGDDL